ncbi:MAG: type II secretion system major pseudopilin GspG [Gammaproteobacteria bacterium]|nr:type II secretion system major pseudopilin GspG [Gammaproteobacteria bacterium]
MKMQHLKRKIRKTRQSGVTLIELLVVLVIIAILAATIIPNFFDAPDKARVVRAKQDVRALENSLILFKLDNFNYPSSLQDLVQKPGNAPNWKQGGYLERLPKDPWGNDYQYRNPGRESNFDVFSFGADGSEGGDGTATDIGNWNL